MNRRLMDSTVVIDLGVLALGVVLLVSSVPACSDDDSVSTRVDARTDALQDAAAFDVETNRDASVDGHILVDASLDAQPEDGGAEPFVPYFHDDFESYADGQSLTGGQPFGAAGRTVASAEVAHWGSRSARMEIQEGDGGGFGRWGGILSLDPALPKGSEVWVSLWVYWPASFQFTASPWMKFLRLHNRTGTGENGGYNDLYVDNADGATSVLRTIKENHDVWAVYDGPSLPRDQWERYEMYLFIDDKSVDEGGSGRVRIWRNDELIFDRTDVPTITEAQGTINAFYLFTYWNNENPPNNHLFVDDLVIATSDSPPPNFDSAGNRFIGDWPQ